MGIRVEARVTKTWRLQMGDVYLPGEPPIPWTLAVNPWFWRGRKIGLAVGRLVYR